MFRILIADDHAIVRKGLRQLLSLVQDLEVVGEADNGWDVIDKARTGGFDVLLLDMTMPGPSGVELVKRVRAENPSVPILVLTMHGESQVAGRVIKAGAAGYLTKGSEPENLITAIRQVAAGGHYIDPTLAEQMVFDAHHALADVPHQKLSEREYQIFLMLAKGQGINDIAQELHLSAKTVSTHKFRLMQKLNLDTVSSLVRYALKHQLVLL